MPAPQLLWQRHAADEPARGAAGADRGLRAHVRPGALGRLGAGLLASLTVFGAASGRSPQEQPSEIGPQEPEESEGFGTELAQLISERCAGCHHPGGSGPFSMLAYDDVAKRAAQIRLVAERRFMPPWKPEPGYGRFLGERRLTDDELARLLRWIDAGAPRGVGAAVPPPRIEGEGWALGEPDLIYAMPEPFVVPAEGTDVYRTFVLPVATTREHFVDGVEFRVTNPKVTHHAVLYVDGSGRARAADEAAAGEGYPGMELALYPGHGGLDGWVPGATQRRLPEGVAWRLPAGADLVLEGHFRPSGRAEHERFEVGLHLAAKPPRGTLVLVRLAVGGLNIPAGEASYAARDELELPVDVRVVAIQPHAHNVCREIRADARLPDGGTVPLVWIRDWDFDWQEAYRFAEPVALPRGTRIEASLRYDNSRANERNPSDPPRRVLGGTRTQDEMAYVWLQVIARDEHEASVLREVMERHTRAKDGDYRLEVLWRALVEHVDSDGDGSLDAGEEQAARVFLDSLTDDSELVRTAFDVDGSGSLEGAERDELLRFREPWQPAAEPRSP